MASPGHTGAITHIKIYATLIGSHIVHDIKKGTLHLFVLPSFHIILGKSISKVFVILAVAELEKREPIPSPSPSDLVKYTMVID